jgi:diphthamide synthase subunit DPH2
MKKSYALINGILKRELKPSIYNRLVKRLHEAGITAE